ncbi:MAG: hydroxymethylbilane synthase [Acidimicrobiales bacterium]|nr:hydroxymethylbilane synthase [Acidimicrobiales bacterium]
MKLRAATRGSPLALWQTSYVASLLQPLGIEVEPLVVKTVGDQDQSSPLHAIGGQGIFVKEIQQAVLDEKANFAVHSLKDLPSLPVNGLLLASVPRRGDPRDVLVGCRLEDLPSGANIATGSVRRKAQLTALRPDLNFHELRGNIETRLAKAENFDAIVMASVALKRLNLNPSIVDTLEPSIMIPQVGQGAIGLECLTEDTELRILLERIEDRDSRTLINAEREFLIQIGADCSQPVAGHATFEAGSIRLRAFLGNEETKRVFFDDRIGSNAELLGRDSATALLEKMN